MRRSLTLMTTGVLAAMVSSTLTEGEGEGDGTAKKAEAPALFMRHTGGWGAGVLAELAVQRDGRFRYRTKKEDLQGTIPTKEVQALIRHIASVGAGPAAEDAGYVQFKWIDENGRPGGQDYSYPRKEPCHSLLTRIKALVAKHGKEPAIVIEKVTEGVPFAMAADDASAPPRNALYRVVLRAVPLKEATDALAREMDVKVHLPKGDIRNAEVSLDEKRIGLMAALRKITAGKFWGSRYTWGDTKYAKGTITSVTYLLDDPKGK